ASITSTRMRSRWRAMRSFSSLVIDAPGLCSPSRMVVSNMINCSFMVKLRCQYVRCGLNEFRRACWRCEPGTAELGLEYLAREAQQQAGQKQAAEVKLQICASGMHARNIAGLTRHCNWEGGFGCRRFFHIQ